jgi:hypothetical protein
MLAKTGKRFDYPKRQLFINPRKEADSPLPAHLTTFKVHQDNPEGRDL